MTKNERILFWVLVLFSMLSALGMIIFVKIMAKIFVI